MSAEFAMTMGRARAESLMLTEGIVRRANGGTSMDPVTLGETADYDTIYTGPCRLRLGESQPGDAAIPGAVATDQTATLSFPVATSGDITTGDVWECTANPSDPELVGKFLRIAGVHSQSFATARRFPVVEAS